MCERVISFTKLAQSTHCPVLHHVSHTLIECSFPFPMMAYEQSGSLIAGLGRPGDSSFQFGCASSSSSVSCHDNGTGRGTIHSRGDAVTSVGTEGWSADAGVHATASGGFQFGSPVKYATGVFQFGAASERCTNQDKSCHQTSQGTDADGKTDFSFGAGHQNDNSVRKYRLRVADGRATGTKGPGCCRTTGPRPCAANMGSMEDAMHHEGQREEAAWKQVCAVVSACRVCSVLWCLHVVYAVCCGVCMSCMQCAVVSACRVCSVLWCLHVVYAVCCGVCMSCMRLMND